MAAIRFLAQNEKKSKFQNKRFGELQKLVQSPNHTRANARVKFPDGLLLQGTFGAKETIGEIYAFVRENLFTKDRPFYLYETPPKRELTDMKASLIQ